MYKQISSHLHSRPHSYKLVYTLAHMYNACVIHPMQTHAIHPLCMRNTTVTKKGIMWRWKPNIFFPTIQERGMVNDSIETIQIKGLIAYKYKNKMSAHSTNRAVV